MRRFVVRTIATLVVVLVASTALVGCGGSSGSEDSSPTLDAMLGKDPSAMSDAMMSAGGWSGVSEIGGVEYRVYATSIDGADVHLYYEPVGTSGGLGLYMYDIEPFQLSD